MTGDRTAGVTLVELLIAIGILALIVALSAGQFRNPSRETAATALKVTAMINETGSDARSSQRAACIRQHGTAVEQVYQASPTDDNVLELPQGVTVTPEIDTCFDRFGRLTGPAHTYRLTAAGADEARIIVDAGYGNARVQ